MTKPNSGSNAGGGTTPGGSQEVASTAHRPAVNIQALADRVYELMQRDISLERRRAGGGRR